MAVENVFRHCRYLLGKWDQNILLVEDLCFREIADSSKDIQAEFLAGGVSRTCSRYNRKAFAGRSFEMLFKRLFNLLEQL